ncbi:uncharacterized protein VTP21DRAFT_2344 [Calcarisporiella thermophila]|uniref:uncharacterized protein n=1 Tax=Calcarisporiella thermophila TaxID=911321 RepID=UPI003742F6E8
MQKQQQNIKPSSGSSQVAKTVNVKSGNSVREGDKKRRTVFKNVLDSPLVVTWPNIGVQEQNAILDELCSLLIPIGEYRREMIKFRDAKRKQILESRKRKRQADTSIEKIQSKTLDDTLSAPTTKPPQLNACIFGINAITKALEKQVQINAMSQDCSGETREQDMPMVEAVFVCRADVQPQLLHAHLPMLACFASNVWLCSLPRGAERRLGDLLGMKRVGAIALRKPENLGCSSHFEPLRSLLAKSMQPVTAPGPWVVYDKTGMDANQLLYLPTNIKQLKTSTPIKRPSNKSNKAIDEEGK